MENKTPPFESHTYDPYDTGPQVPPELAEFLVTQVPEGYVKVSVEGERILEPVTANKSRLDMLVEQYNPMLRLVHIDGGYEVYIPEMFVGRSGQR